MLSSEAIDYAWSELVRRAGWTGTPPPMAYTAGEVPEGVRLRVLPSSREFNNPSDKGMWDNHFVPFADAEEPVVLIDEEGVQTIPVDLIKSTLFMLCRVEEQGPGPRDDYDRFPASASWLFREDYIHGPFVDEWSATLQGILFAAYPDWRPAPSNFTVEVSHDIDHVRAFKTSAARLFRAAGDLVKRGAPSQAVATLQSAGDPSRDLYMQAVRTLAAVDEENGFRATFYFQTTDPSPLDAGYKVEEVRDIVAELRDRGHLIGFHPGFDAARDPERFEQEWERFADLTGQTPGDTRVRYHCLRVALPDSWRLLERLGFRYDASLGFASNSGFRAGTSHPYQPFDLENNRVIPVTLEPLVCMDATLQSYQKKTPEIGLQSALYLASLCERHGGTFSLLWHNTGICRHWAHWEPTYRTILKELASG